MSFSPLSPLQNLPVVPLYGDVQIRLSDWVQQLTHYDPSKWTCTSEQTEAKATTFILNRIETIRSEHVRFISDLARYNNEVRLPAGFQAPHPLLPGAVDSARMLCLLGC